MGDVKELRDKAARCRRLARGSPDIRAVAALTALAIESEAKAAEVEARSVPGPIGVSLTTP